MTPTVTPYLSFPGTTREACAFYAKALGATIETMLSYADMPAGPGDDATGCAGGAAPPSGDAIMHACLRLPGGAMIFAGSGGGGSILGGGAGGGAVSRGPQASSRKGVRTTAPRRALLRRAEFTSAGGMGARLAWEGSAVPRTLA